MIVSAVQGWMQLEKEYLHSYWISDTNILIVGEQEGDLSACKMILIYYSFLTRL